MKEIRRPRASRHYIATVAIGEEYYKQWESASLPTWIHYCDRHDLGLLVFSDELISHTDPCYKKSNWQRLLIPSYLQSLGHDAADICYLDTDVIISPLANNIFCLHDPSRIGVVSQRHNLPMSLHQTLRIVAFSRNYYLDNKYPLDSSLFMDPKSLFHYHGFSADLPDDYFCTGVLLFNVEYAASLFSEWFYRYPANIQTITGGGEEPILNFELLSHGSLNILPYEYQALWIYEIASKYPFLYNRLGEHPLVRDCIESSLIANNFLHFAGSWHECQAWKIGDFFNGDDSKEWITRFSEYLDSPVTGNPQGLVRP